MVILTLRTDKPEAEVGVFDGNSPLARETWRAHRELAETIHLKLAEILDKSSKSVEDLQGIVIYKGPGSFTGLRIGFSVANALAYALDIPIVSTTGSDWTKSGLKKLKAGKNERIALPEYGAPARITKPKH